MKRSRRNAKSKAKTKKEKFDLTVTALQYYLKDIGEHMGFLEWKKIDVRQNHKGEDEFSNATIKGVALVENYKRDGIREEVAVNFTYAQKTNMGFDFTDEG